MKPKQAYNQLSNLTCITMYRNQLMALAKNVFKFENMPKEIDLRYMNQKLVTKGRVAFFQDDVSGEYCCLPFDNIGYISKYNEPIDIRVYGGNGFNTKLKYGEYVIIYDNTTYLPIISDIMQYAQRLALIQRTIDINISQQKTPRLWQVPQDMLKSFKQAVNEIDSFDESVATFDNFDVDEINTILAPAPFVTDKLQQEKEKIFAEFLRFIGVASLNIQKKERLIQDEVMSSQGGTIAFRYNRFEPRKDAIKKINEKFSLNISVSYYDGEPSDKENAVENVENIVENSTKKEGDK